MAASYQLALTVIPRERSDRGTYKYDADVTFFLDVLINSALVISNPRFIGVRDP